MQMERQTEILLESGTNELEIMEFTIAGETFGINVAKVVEIMMVCPVKPMQKAQANIEGIFKSRDMVITVIDLGGYLNLPASTNPERDIYATSLSSPTSTTITLLSMSIPWWASPASPGSRSKSPTR